MESELSDVLWERLTAFQTEAFLSRVGGLRHLVHYTNFATLKGIIENEEIWFSSASMMNDLDEIARGKELIQELSAEGQPLHSVVCQIRDHNGDLWQGANKAFVDHLLPDFFHTYLSCWSECDLEAKSHDDLTMWRGYAGNGNGVAIVVDALALGLNDAFRSEIIACPVFYETRAEFAARAETYLNSFRDALLEHEGKTAGHEYLVADAFGELCFYLAVTHKHPGFRAEKEWRFAWRKHRDNGLGKYLRPVVIDQNLIERFCFPIRTDPLVSPHNLDVQTLIASIMVGPCDDAYLKSGATTALLRAKGFPRANTLVEVSTIPFRAPR
jgi:hypothetical protein